MSDNLTSLTPAFTQRGISVYTYPSPSPCPRWPAISFKVLEPVSWYRGLSCHLLHQHLPPELDGVLVCCTLNPVPCLSTWERGRRRSWVNQMKLLTAEDPDHRCHLGEGRTSKWKTPLSLCLSDKYIFKNCSKGLALEHRSLCCRWQHQHPTWTSAPVEPSCSTSSPVPCCYVMCRKMVRGTCTLLGRPR